MSSRGSRVEREFEGLIGTQSEEGLAEIRCVLCISTARWWTLRSVGRLPAPSRAARIVRRTSSRAAQARTRRFNSAWPKVLLSVQAAISGSLRIP